LLSPHGEWVHRLALSTAATTMVLILMGGLVTNTGSALAVPDWPTTFGYNMFTYPPSQWVGGVFYEHSHRLLGSLVGLLTVVFAVMAWRWEPRRWVRWLGVVALVGVIGQGILGGLRVVLLEHGLAIIHGCVAQAFFGLVVALTVVTSRTWQWLERNPFSSNSGALWVLLLVVPLLVYLQIVLGALLTHTGTQLLVHASGAVVVTFAITTLATLVLRHFGDRVEVRRPAMLLVGVVALQLGLGLWAFLWHYTTVAERLPFAAGLAILAAHRMTGTILWAVALVVSLRVFRGARRTHEVTSERMGAGSRVLA